MFICLYMTCISHHFFTYYELQTTFNKQYKPMDMILMIKKSKRLKITDNEWEEWKPYVSNIQHLKLLLSSSWSQHSSQRPSFSQICQLLDEIAHDQFNK